MNTPTPQALSEAQMAAIVNVASNHLNGMALRIQDATQLAIALIASRAEVERLRTALNPRMWDARMSAAWHVAIPDLQVAFDAIRSIAAQDKENGNG